MTDQIYGLPETWIIWLSCPDMTELPWNLNYMTEWSRLPWQCCVMHPSSMSCWTIRRISDSDDLRSDRWVAWLQELRSNRSNYLIQVYSILVIGTWFSDYVCYHYMCLLRNQWISSLIAMPWAFTHVKKEKERLVQTTLLCPFTWATVWRGVSRIL